MHHWTMKQVEKDFESCINSRTDALLDNEKEFESCINLNPDALLKQVEKDFESCINSNPAARGSDVMPRSKQQAFVILSFGSNKALCVLLSSSAGARFSRKKTFSLFLLTADDRLLCRAGLVFALLTVACLAPRDYFITRLSSIFPS